MMNIPSCRILWLWLIIVVFSDGNVHLATACGVTAPAAGPPISFTITGTDDRTTLQCFNCNGATISNCPNVFCTTAGSCIGTNFINVQYLLCFSSSQAACQNLLYDPEPCLQCIGTGCAGQGSGTYGATCASAIPNYCIVTGPTSLSYTTYESTGGTTVACNTNCNSATFMNCNNVLCDGDALCLDVAVINIQYVRCSSPTLRTCSGRGFFGPLCIHCLGMGCQNANDVGYFPLNGGTCNVAPSAVPSGKPSRAPSSKPSLLPSGMPSFRPSKTPVVLTVDTPPKKNPWMLYSIFASGAMVVGMMGWCLFLFG